LLDAHELGGDHLQALLGPGQVVEALGLDVEGASKGTLQGAILWLRCEPLGESGDLSLELRPVEVAHVVQDHLARRQQTQEDAQQLVEALSAHVTEVAEAIDVEGLGDAENPAAGLEQLPVTVLALRPQTLDRAVHLARPLLLLSEQPLAPDQILVSLATADAEEVDELGGEAEKPEARVGEAGHGGHTQGHLVGRHLAEQRYVHPPVEGVGEVVPVAQLVRCHRLNPRPPAQRPRCRPRSW